MHCRDLGDPKKVGGERVGGRASLGVLRLAEAMVLQEGT